MTTPDTIVIVLLLAGTAATWFVIGRIYQAKREKK